MIAKNESDVKTPFAQAGEEVRRAGYRITRALDEWIEWRAEKLQGIRREIIANTRPGRKPRLADNEPSRPRRLAAMHSRKE